MARKPLSKKTRFDVFKRDGFACQYCGAHPPQVLLHADHVNPVANGGENDIDNLVTACDSCNLGKGARLLSAVPESLQDKSARIAEQEAQLEGYMAIMQAKRDRVERDVWVIIKELYGSEETTKARFRSTKIFVERLGFHETLEAAEAASAARIYSNERIFRYFCGVCWNKIADLGL